MAQSSSSSLSESTHLIRNTSIANSHLHLKKILCLCPQAKHLCLPSRAAGLVMLWTLIVGTMYHLEVLSVASLVFSTNLLQQYHHPSIVTYYGSLPYAILAFIMMFYPLSGFIADVCCGRLKTVVTSLIFLFLSSIVMLLLVLLYAFHHSYDDILVLSFSLSVNVVTFTIGLVGYHSNHIQLGLDQLFEAPSRYLGLFIHYAVWAFQFGSIFYFALILTYFCVNHYLKWILLALLIILTMLCMISILFLCWKSKWFYSEPGHDNPYKTVYDIIKFVKNHKHPLQRSAFTYSDNYIPSRVDFAKERYGGPFSTEQVENVKTFFRMLVVLFAVGPVFSMEAAASLFVFPSISVHMFHVIIKRYNMNFCHSEVAMALILGSGGVKDITSTMFLFPVYIWIIFSLLHKIVPKLFPRLGIGIVICLLGVVSLLIIDTVGHSMYREANTNHTQCMFQMSLTTRNKTITYPTLNMHWAVLIPPNLFLGIGPLIVIATTLEFISAQSPQSMKGFLVGVFFAIRGLFQFLNTIIIIPLSLKKPWASREMIEHPPVINCGSVYLLVTSVTGLIGLILFSVAAKRYEYRRRDEGWFRQHDVEEIYDRYLPQAAVDDDSSYQD